MSFEKANIEITPEFNRAIGEKLEKLVGDEFDSAIKKIQEKKNEIISGILLSVHKEVSINSIGNTVTFTIREISK